MQDLLVSFRDVSSDLLSSLCSVEYKKEQKANGVPDSGLGEVKDRPPLPGNLSEAEVVKHVMEHQSVLRRLKDKVVREDREKKVKMEEEESKL